MDAALLPERLPASRHAARRRRDTLPEEGVRVPVPRLDLRPRRRAPARAAPGGLPRSRGGRRMAWSRSPLESRHGLLWVHPTPGVALAARRLPRVRSTTTSPSFDLASHVLYRRIDTVRRANWKLVIDAVPRGVPHPRPPPGHDLPLLSRRAAPIAGLRRTRTSASATAGVARRRGRRRRGHRTSASDFTFTHFVFPNSTLIFHPDYVSHIAVFPVDVDQVRWVHAMLVPATQAGSGARRALGSHARAHRGDGLPARGSLRCRGHPGRDRVGRQRRVSRSAASRARSAHFHATIERELGSA